MLKSIYNLEAVFTKTQVDMQPSETKLTGYLRTRLVTTSLNLPHSKASPTKAGQPGQPKGETNEYIINYLNCE